MRHLTLLLICLLTALFANAQTVSPQVANGPAFSHAPAIGFTLQNKQGRYSDITQGDFVEKGQRFRKEGGKTYRAYYWINEHPWTDEDDRPKDLGEIELVNGLTVSIRKIYYDVTWPQGETFTSLIRRQWEKWGDGKDGSKDAIWKAIALNVVTANGKNLQPGNLRRLRNPSWLDAASWLPQWYGKPAAAQPDKPVVMHNIPREDDKAATVSKLRAAGITHLWRNSLAAISDETSVSKDPLHPALMLSSDEFMKYGEKGYAMTREQCREFADTVPLKDHTIVTDEYSEGQRPQPAQQQEWIYERFAERIKEQKLKGVMLIGEYAIRNVKVWGFQKDFQSPREPMSAYALSLLTPDIVKNLGTDGGWPNGALGIYAQGSSKNRGTSIGCYWSLEHVPVSDYLVSLAQNAIFHYNAVPDQPRLLFTWPSMQSNTVASDLVAYNPGWPRKDGKIQEGWPTAPPEMMKILGFFGMLFYDSVYLWDDWGTRPVTDENSFPKLSLSTDSFLLGTQWYSQLIPVLNQARRDIEVCDYATRKLQLKSKTKERRISRRGKSYFNNSYFNEVGEKRCGMAFCIPGPKKAFVYLNSYHSPMEIETVVVEHGGKRYNLGEIPGMTLTVALEP